MINRQNGESQNGERKKSIRQAYFWPVFLKTHFDNLGAQKRKVHDRVQKGLPKTSNFVEGFHKKLK